MIPALNTLAKIVPVTLALWLPACATAIRGPNVGFHVITNPPGATVTTDLMTPESRRESERLQYLVRTGVLDDVGDVDVVHYACESTPCEFELSRRSNFTLVVEREGYHTATVEVTSGFGRVGTASATAGTVATATGAYLVSYSLWSGLASGMATILTLGTTTASSTGAASAATAMSATRISRSVTRRISTAISKRG